MSSKKGAMKKKLENMHLGESVYNHSEEAEFSYA